MKKLILIAFIGSLFAAGTAFAHCGSCGVGDEAKEHKHEAKGECCGKDGKCCHEKKECCGTEGKCCKDKGECKDACKKECEDKKAEAAAAKVEGKACCPAKAAQPA